MDFLFTHLTIEGIVAGVSGLFAVVAYLYRYVFPKIKKFFQDHAELGKIVPVVHAMERLVSQELRTNGGSSLKDAINSLLIDVSALHGKFRVLASHSNLFGWESDNQGRCIWVSPMLCAMLGRQAEDFLGHAWRGLIAQEHREDVLEEWDAAIEERRTFYRQYGLIHRDGQNINVVGLTYCVRDLNGKIHGYLGVVKPITVPNTALAN